MYFMGILYLYFLGNAIANARNQCEPIRTPLCQGLYNETTFPNSLQHRSQEDAILELHQYQKLLLTGCAKYLKLFICSLFLPVCTVLEKPLLPCRELCEETKKAGCEAILKRYVNIAWPEQLACHKLPSKNDLICIMYEKEEAGKMERVTIPENKRVKISDRSQAILECEKPKKIDFKKISHTESSCNRGKSKMQLKKICNGEYRCEFRLSDIVAEDEICKKQTVGISAIKYQCVNANKSRKITLIHPQDEVLKCKNKARHIVVTKVQFLGHGCITPNAYCVVSQACTGLHRCPLMADDTYLKSSCESEGKKLVVDYECVKTSPVERKIEVDLMNDININCEVNELIRIVRAEYIGECHQKEIHCAVTLACDKKNSCTINDKKLRASAVMCHGGKMSRVRIRFLCT